VGIKDLPVMPIPNKKDIWAKIGEEPVIGLNSLQF
jgi:hypothetical protein